MTDNTMEYMTVSMCGADALDWCRGYNEAVTKANEIINRQQQEIERLETQVIIYSKKNYIKGIKDLAERLKEKCGNAPLANRLLDNLADEMIGEQE